MEIAGAFCKSSRHKSKWMEVVESVVFFFLHNLYSYGLLA